MFQTFLVGLVVYLCTGDFFLKACCYHLFILHAKEELKKYRNLHKSKQQWNSVK